MTLIKGGNIHPFGQLSWLALLVCSSWVYISSSLSLKSPWTSLFDNVHLSRSLDFLKLVLENHFLLFLLIGLKISPKSNFTFSSFPFSCVSLSLLFLSQVLNSLSPFLPIPLINSTSWSSTPCCMNLIMVTIMMRYKSAF